MFAEFTYSALGFRTEGYEDITLEVSRWSGRRNSLRSGGRQGCVERRAGLGVRGEKLDKDSPELLLECVSGCDCASADGQGLGAELSELQKWAPARLVGFAWEPTSHAEPQAPPHT